MGYWLQYRAARSCLIAQSFIWAAVLFRHMASWVNVPVHIKMLSWLCCSNHSLFLGFPLNSSRSIGPLAWGLRSDITFGQDTSKFSKDLQRFIVLDIQKALCYYRITFNRTLGDSVYIVHKEVSQTIDSL